MTDAETIAVPAAEPRIVEYDIVTGNSIILMIYNFVVKCLKELRGCPSAHVLILNHHIVHPPPFPGVPSEYNEFLPKDCEEYKRWKLSQVEGIEGQVSNLTVTDSGNRAETQEPSAEAPKASSGKKKKQVPMIVLERNTRNKKKCITTISGLDVFGVKLSEASKLFGKKFASGASITKNAEGKEQIDCQGDFLDQAAELILKQFKEVKREDVYYIEGKKKERYFTD